MSSGDVKEKPKKKPEECMERSILYYLTLLRHPLPPPKPLSLSLSLFYVVANSVNSMDSMDLLNVCSCF